RSILLSTHGDRFRIDTGERLPCLERRTAEWATGTAIRAIIAPIALVGADPPALALAVRSADPETSMKRGLAALGFGVVLAWVLLPRPAYSHNPTTTTVLFNREIATLLQRKCLQCHAEGKMAMPLTTYTQARPWAEAIKEETLARRMPPWPA